MVNLGFFSLSEQTDQTLVALMFADALSSKGNGVLFLNVGFDGAGRILDSYAAGSFNGFVNKKDGIDRITTRLHFLNLDLINVLSDEVRWLNAMEPAYLETIVGNFMKAAAARGYDYLVVSADRGRLNGINKTLLGEIDALVMLSNPSRPGDETLRTIREIATMPRSGPPQRRYILLTRFCAFSKNAAQIADFLRLSFPRMSLDHHVPDFRKDGADADFLGDEKSFLAVSDRIRPVFNEIINAIK